MPRTLLLTNDFPPRPGGIQSYLAQLVSRLPAEDLVVYAPAWRGAAAYDASVPFPVVRHPTSLLLPESRVLRRAREVALAERCEVVWFGAAAPLGLLARRLASAGLRRAVASTHGHEVGWAMLPGARQALRRIGSGLDAVTCVSGHTRARLRPALGARPRLVTVHPGVDTATFRPRVGDVRRQLGLGASPVVLCVSRLVGRKGQDQLIRALPAWRRAVPGTRLLLVGGGPDRDRLTRLAREHGVADAVDLTGSVPEEDLPAYYAAGTVFAMPCRSRRRGLEVEGLGIVFLEAAACGLPVVVGDSGGAPEAVVDGVTGHLVDGTRLAAVTDAVLLLLAAPDEAQAMGARGREWVAREWRWDAAATRMAAVLAGGQSP